MTYTWTGSSVPRKAPTVTFVCPECKNQTVEVNANMAGVAKVICMRSENHKSRRTRVMVLRMESG